MTTTPTRDGLAARLRSLLPEGRRFLTVGGLGYVVDVAAFNLLLGTPDSPGPMGSHPLSAKAVAVVLATVVTFTGHRAWTYRHRGRGRTLRRYALFFGFNAIGLGIALAPLAVSRYLLGLSGVWADNIAANVIGLGLGTLFRWWAYRTWVFRADRELSAG